MSFTTYMQAHARKLDWRLFEHLFKGADAQFVFDELSAYQNADGGFGNALEPDLRLPDSSALATTVALQYLAKINASNGDMVSRAVSYLLKTYDTSKQGWLNIPPAADAYPRAPWWGYNAVLEWAQWGNPSAEIVGYLLQYANIVKDQAFLKKISQRAVQQLHQITEPEQHEVKCYVRLYKYADKQLQAKLYGRLAAHIKQLAKTDPKDWEGYVATPLTFVESPDSPFAALFDRQVLQDNIAFLRRQIVGGDHWEPTWQWGQFDKEWTQAKQEWSGKLTADNLLLLRAFGVGLDV